MLTGAGRAFSAGGDIRWFGEVQAGGPTQARIDVALANSLAQQLRAERAAQLLHSRSDFFNHACVRFLARARQD